MTIVQMTASFSMQNIWWIQWKALPLQTEMLNHKLTKGYKIGMKKVMITAALAMMTMGAMAQTVDNDTTCYEPEQVYKAGTMPKFKSGMGSMVQYLYNNLRYPKEAEKEMVEAKVLTTFIVEKDGSLSNITPVNTTLQFFDAKKKAEKLGMTEEELKQHFGKMFQEEAIRVLTEMPKKWKPGKIAGKPVRTKFEMPVHFGVGRFTGMGRR